MSDKRKALTAPAGVKTLETFFGIPTSNKRRDTKISNDAGAGPFAADAAEGPAVNNAARLEQPSSEAGPSTSSLPADVVRRIQINKSVALARQLQTQVESRVRTARQEGNRLQLHELLIEPSWRKALAAEMEKESFQNLEKFLAQEWSGREKIFPEEWNIFRALNTCPLDKVRVVLLGQDPYHDDGQAQGLSFSVPKGTKVPSSLLNMLKELEADVGCKRPPHGDLERWAAQGVLLLNTVLTVRAHQANSHQKRGWEVFTDGVIRTVSREGRGVVFLLWGKQAQDKARLVDQGAHLMLACAHPSGLSAHRGFFGCKHYSKANEYIQRAGAEPIDWDLNSA